LYTVGAVVGACALAGTVSMVGVLVGAPAVRLLVAGSMAVVVLLSVALRKQLRFPQRRWQVPQSWFRRSGRLALLPAGFTLALGFVTPIWVPTYYVLVLSYLALSPPVALVIGAIYGVARSARNWYGVFHAPPIGIDSKQLRLILNIYVYSLPWVVVGLAGIGLAAFVETVVA
jgi:hypothetical protein